MDLTLAAVVLLIITALFFDYINGFHDAANSIATVVSTRVLSPGKAVIWAAAFNFIAAFVFGTAVAQTIGKGTVDITVVTLPVIFGGLIGAILWSLMTWWLALPTSSSHALIGGYAGAAVAKAGMAAVLCDSCTAWSKTLTFIVLSPLIGLVVGHLLMIAILWIFKGFSPGRVDRWFRRLQLVSAGFFSLNHGGNDAQKTAGIITGVLFTGGLIKAFEVPYWVLMASYSAIALGTLSGGWRIVRTMGGRLTRLKPRSGFCAETGAAISVFLCSHIGVPVSTTHAIAGAIAGVGSIQRMKAVRWGIATNIVWAWVMTIPAAAILAWLSFYLLRITIGA
jgi:inorganic phosphate transporter, PiT family